MTCSVILWASDFEREVSFNNELYIKSDKYGQIILNAKEFEEDISIVKIHIEGSPLDIEQKFEIDWRDEVLKALRLNLYDYFYKSVKRLYLNSGYKRRQLVQTIKVSESAFGIGMRYPVSKKINTF